MPLLPKHKLLCLLFVLLIAPMFAQVNNGKQLSGIQQDSLRAVTWQRQTDSLRVVFNNEPKFISVAYIKNGKLKPLKNCKLFICIDSITKEIEPESLDLGIYPVKFKVDSTQKITIKLVVGGTTIQQRLDDVDQIKNGAHIEFGQITNIYKRAKKMANKPKNDNDELTEMDKFYIQFLDNQRLVEQIKQKKINYIQYVEVTPTVFGCGAVTRHVVYTSKKH